jgi:hypothetical protein
VSDAGDGQRELVGARPRAPVQVAGREKTASVVWKPCRVPSFLELSGLSSVTV